MVERGARDGKEVGERTLLEVPNPSRFIPEPSPPMINPLPPFCTAIILYYKLALFPNPASVSMHEKLKTTHTKMGRFFFFFSLSFSLSPGCVLSVRSGVGGLGPG